MARSLSMSARLLVLLLLLGTACGGPPPPAGHETKPSSLPSAGDSAAGRPVVTFAGRALTEADVSAAMRQLPAPSRAFLKDPARRRDFVDNLVLNELLYDEGQRLGYDDDPEVERQVRELRKRLVVQRLMRDYRQRPEVTDEEARAYYDEHRALYSNTRVRASHILLEDRATAEEVRAELLDHPDRFAALARERSTDQMSAKRGGDLGRFGPGRLVGEVERVAFTLAKGDISEVVESRYGFHVIMVTERTQGTQRSFEDVARQVKSKLAAERLQKDVEARLAMLREAADVRVYDDVISNIEVPEVAADETSGFHGH
jgi:peptidyl-prolyl cis-trans isomerase C